MSVFSRDVYCIAGLPFDAISQTDAVARLRVCALRGQRNFFSTPNLNFLIAAQSDVAFRDSVIHSDLSLADGMPVVWLARLLGLPIRERVAGASVFEALRLPAGRALRVFFFGGPAGAAEAACAALNAEAGGGLVGCGALSPGFGSLDEMSGEAVTGQINACEPDFVLVALGAKKGQAWIERNREGLRAPLISHLGAVVNFAAGTVSRAPRWMQQLGLEWLWRIREEPALWRRYWRDGCALFGLLFGRALPLAVYTRWARPVGAAQVVFSSTEGAGRLQLAGAWRAADLAPLRAALTQAAASGKAVALDLGEVSWLDSASIALLMLLGGQLQLRGASLRVVACSPVARRLLRLNCAEFLLEKIQAEGLPPAAED